MTSGGARPGAGRKAIDGKRVTYTVRVKPATLEIIREMKAEGVSIGDLIDKECFIWKLRKDVRRIP